MNKKIYLYLSVFLVFISGCSIIDGKPNIEGYVMSARDRSILVVSDEAIDFSFSGGVEEFYDATSVSNIPEEVAVGEKVAIWFDGVVNESYPSQTSAGKMEIIESYTPEGAQLSEAEVLNKVLTQPPHPDDSVGVQSIKFDNDKNEWFVTLKGLIYRAEYDYQIEDQ